MQVMRMCMHAGDMLEVRPDMQASLALVYRDKLCSTILKLITRSAHKPRTTYLRALHCDWLSTALQHAVEASQAAAWVQVKRGTCTFQSGEMLFLALDQGRRHLHYLPIGQLKIGKIVSMTGKTVSIDRQNSLDNIPQASRARTALP